MQYALVNGVRTEPSKALKGICTGCNGDVIAKCGDIKVHHWAHKSIKDCDPWAEPETPWHREWKDKFPPEFREVVFRDENTKEIHRADVHTPRGITLEFQNSPISIQEIKSRDQFYPKLIWVVNAAEFDVQSAGHIPNPTSPLLNDFEFICDKNGMGSHLTFYRKRGRNLDSKSLYMYETVGIEHYDLREVKTMLEESGGRYTAFTWKYASLAWLTTKSPVFLDFGYPDLYWLRTRPQDINPLRYLQVVKKIDFIHKYSQ